MQDWIEKVLLGVIQKYLTKEILEEMEKAAKKHVIKLLREVAKSTPNTLDDKVVDLVAQVLGE